MTALDRRSPVPLWAQLADDLRARAAAGTFADRLPTEDELTSAYGVSRNTVREALRRLREEGLVHRERGRGTFLAEVDIEQPLRGHYSLARTIESQGLEEHSEVLASEIHRAGQDAGAAEMLGLAPADEVVHIERLRFAGSEPLALDRSWLPAAFTRPLLDADLSHGSLYDVLRDRCGLHITRGWERITPTIPSSHERRVLQLAAPDAAFAVERLASTRDRPVEWRHSLVRGDRYRFVSEWP